jgi:ArsR family transcriptional regulator, arsenate/arsenite/antimonite-responsive transcriptional repressor / arsenate reductase (thioredoxin)
MKLELNHSIESRALKHAALADAGRLRIVDLLTLGDLSASELQDELGMASNLLAHHLRTLEGVGIIARHRSEGDRRRSYVTLTPGALEGLAPGSELTASRVVFVCTANSARSQLAAALWNTASRVPAVSAGTHPAERIADGALLVAAAHALEIPDAAPRALERVVSPDDFVVTVCDSAREELGDAASVHWSIADPVRVGSEAAFESVYAALEGRVRELSGRLTAA